MRRILVVLALAPLVFCASRSSSDNNKAPGNDGKTKVIKEQVRGGIAFPPETRQWTRITGKVKVLTAHTLLFGDGTEVDLNGASDAPDLAQKGRIGEAFYPCGKEAAEFLRQLIGDKTVTCFANPDNVQGKQVRLATAVVGETNLNIEMVRNGWAISNHRGMDTWEIIARESKRGLWRGGIFVPRRRGKGGRAEGGEVTFPAKQAWGGRGGLDQTPEPGRGA